MKMKVKVNLLGVREQTFSNHRLLKGGFSSCRREWGIVVRGEEAAAAGPRFKLDCGDENSSEGAGCLRAKSREEQSRGRGGGAGQVKA